MIFRFRVNTVRLVLACLMSSVCSAAPQSLSSTPTAVEDIIGLSAGEKTHDQALLRLQSLKKEELTVTLRTLFKQPSTVVFAVRAISELGFEELQPEIDQLVATTTSFDVVQAANISAREIHEKLRGLLVAKKNSSLKSTLIGKLKEPLTDAEFEKLVDDPDYLVRESVVSQFFISMSALEAETQNKRFTKLLNLKPVQARTSAMNLYRFLDENAKLRFKSVWKTANCASERVAETKSLCRLLQKESLK